LDTSGMLLMANDPARRMFGLGAGDVGRPIQDLELSYRPVELRSHLDALAREPRAIDLKGARWRGGEHERILDVRIMPLLGEGAVLGTSVSYIDVTEAHDLQEQLTRSKGEL